MNLFDLLNIDKESIPVVDLAITIEEKSIINIMIATLITALLIVFVQRLFR